MIVIGVTGGIGSGKSEILRYLKEKYGSRVLLSDELAKEMEAPGGALYQPLIALLKEACEDGAEQQEVKKKLLCEDGNLNTAVVASLIFQKKGLLQKVNELVHPAVCRSILEEIEKERETGEYRFFVVESALLIESSLISDMDTVWYIYCNEDVRRQRLKSSRGYSDEKIEGIIRKQQTEEAFREACDVVIDNSGDLQSAYAQIDAAINRFNRMQTETR